MHWGIESGHLTVPPNSSGPLAAALGNSYTVRGLLPETSYWISVTSRKSYTDPVSGVTTDYESIALPKSIGADVDGDGVQDSSYPPEVMATTTEPAFAELTINRRVALGTRVPVPPLATVFDPACVASVFRLCADETIPGPVDGMSIAAEARVTGGDKLWFYEHSDPTQIMKLSKQGMTLLFASN